MSKDYTMVKMTDTNFKIYLHKLSEILLNFYNALEIIAYEKFEISASEVIDFSAKKKEIILERTQGILDSFLLAYQTATNEFEELTLMKLGVPTLQQKKEIDTKLIKLGKNFDLLLKIIRAKIEVSIEQLDENGIVFDKIDILRKIEKTSFKQIIDSWKSGSYLFNIK